MSSSELIVDLGTSRIKVSWLDSSGNVQLLRWKQSCYLPSIVHLPKEETDILLGTEALEAAEQDPIGLVANFKRDLIEKGVRQQTHPDRQDSDQLLINAWFCCIRDACFEQIPELGSVMPENVTLTVPARQQVLWHRLLQEGAESIGLLSLQIVKEPVAAARGWLSAHGNEIDGNVLVVDCGGGTTDWALVEKRGSRYSLSKIITPGSENLGGCDVDRALLARVLAENGDRVTQTAAQSILQKVKIYKDSVLSGEKVGPIRLGGRPLSLDVETVRKSYRDALVNPLGVKLSAVLQQAQDVSSDIVVLLVGGAASDEMLEALRPLTTLPVEIHPEPGLAVVKGMLSGTKPRVEDSKSNLHSVDASLPLVKLDRPMIYGWDDSAVKRWQQQVAEVLSLPIHRQLKLMGGRNNPEMVLIPPGRFLMGSPSTEHGRNDNERQHEVAIDCPFYMGIYPITFDEYDLFCDSTHRFKPDDEEWGRGKRPVINVEYEAVLAYCDWASDLAGCCVRPASEAEWEYACRAGSTTAYHFGDTIDDQLANYDARYTQNFSNKGRFRKKTIEVGSFPPNPWGLYDMHGNVCEWTGSLYLLDRRTNIGDQTSGSEIATMHGASLVLRGGGWNNLSGKCRSASRQQNYAGVSSRSWGFRVCCDLPVSLVQR